MFGKKVVERLSGGVHVRWFRRVSEKLVALPNDIICIVFVFFSFLRRRGHVCVCVCVCVCVPVFFKSVRYKYRLLGTRICITNNPLVQCFFIHNQFLLYLNHGRLQSKVAPGRFVAQKTAYFATQI